MSVSPIRPSSQTVTRRRSESEGPSGIKDTRLLARLCMRTCVRVSVEWSRTSEIVCGSGPRPGDQRRSGRSPVVRIESTRW